MTLSFVETALATGPAMGNENPMPPAELDGEFYFRVLTGRPYPPKHKTPLRVVQAGMVLQISD